MIERSVCSGYSLFAKQFSRFSLGISKSHSRMYLKWTRQNLTSFANSLSLSLSLSLESSFFCFLLPSCKYDMSPFEVEVVCTDFIGKMISQPAGIERDSIPTYHETHVFATVIRSFHCFKIGSFKFLAEWSSVYWLTAYCISMPPSLLARFITIPFRMVHTSKAIAVNSLLIVSCS